MKEENKERFVRWQRITIEQFSFVNNLFLVFSAGLFTFLYTFIENSEKFSYTLKVIFVAAIILNILSFLAGVFCAINRLEDFRLTTAIAKGSEDIDLLKTARDEAKGLGEITWNLLYTQIYLMLFSCGGILFLVCLENQDKF